MECGCILRRWRKWIRLVVVVVYVVLLVIALPLCIWELERKGAPDHVQAWFIAGLFVMLALPISFWGILQHVINYTTPRLQRHIIRILWMVPIYAMNAWFALRFPAAAIYLDTLRECYEAYVIYNFMAYLMSFLNHEYPHLDIQVENKPPVKHVFPLCCLPPCHNSPKFIQRCKHGVLQYTVVRPAMTVIALICEMFGKYEEGELNFTNGWSYIAVINNMSQILAMYCLILFYKAFKEELQPLKPVPKFLCVKAVVFLSFWQALLIAILTETGAIPKNGTWVFYKDEKEVSTGLQDFLICIEMFLAAVAHYFSFSHKPFVNLAAEQQDCLRSFLSMWDVRDVTEDVVEHARYIGRGMHKTLSRGKRMGDASDGERTPLLINGEGPPSASGSSLDRQVSVQNQQMKLPPSPAVILDTDGTSIGGDSLTASGRHFDSFVNKSTTSSMNNYADFETSGELFGPASDNKSLSSSISLQAYDSANEDGGVESRAHVIASTVNANQTGASALDEKDFRFMSSESSVEKRDQDDVFEHLDVTEEDSGGAQRNSDADEKFSKGDGGISLFTGDGGAGERGHVGEGEDSGKPIVSPDPESEVPDMVDSNVQLKERTDQSLVAGNTHTGIDGAPVA
ncbi:transmembrane protein 184C [Aplysia californica]|uniref:Transmembrane protein 184C n=1 Tax=Aplysia californica TaxID=6500 RepID=A0ABM0JMS1_APLCA|nr:transmembrane protein 184C [Aplysia californica]